MDPQGSQEPWVSNCIGKWGKNNGKHLEKHRKTEKMLKQFLNLALSDIRIFPLKEPKEARSLEFPYKAPRSLESS